MAFRVAGGAKEEMEITETRLGETNSNRAWKQGRNESVSQNENTLQSLILANANKVQALLCADANNL
jgi:hypothetical protein